jgi:hypothetical protein
MIKHHNQLYRAILENNSGVKLYIQHFVEERQSILLDNATGDTRIQEMDNGLLNVKILLKGVAEGKGGVHVFHLYVLMIREK